MEEEDRLSSLPDTILTDILSLLPITTAAATSALSHRWHHLWTSVSTFIIKSSTFESSIIHHILNRLTSPKLHVFDYHCDLGIERNDFGSATSCFRQICDRNVDEFKFRSDGVIPVPTFIFHCKSLIVLELVGVLDCNFNADDELGFGLPNLKKLRLQADNHNCLSMVSFLKYCPMLEDLCLILKLSKANKCVIDICALNLRKLEIEMKAPALWSLISINTPKLAKLRINDPCSRYKFVNVPNKLVEAYINLRCLEKSEWNVYDDRCRNYGLIFDSHIRKISEFIGEMSSLRKLQVVSRTDIYTILVAGNYAGYLPAFGNLACLKLTLVNLHYWTALLDSLESFPILKHLEVKMDDFYSGRDKVCVVPDTIIRCFTNTLKKIIIKGLICGRNEILLLEYILSHANVLEELLVYVSGDGEDEEDQLWKEYKFCEALFKLRRSCVTCKVMVSGKYILSSSDSFKNGRLRCEILCYD